MRWAWPGDLNRFICRSRRRVGWCEFSARLFKPLCFRCSTEGITSPLAGAVAGQLVRDHHTRGPALLFQQLAEQALGGLLVPPALDEDVEHEAILVDSPPKPVLLAPDRQAHFVQVPLVASTGQLAADLV